MTPRYDSDHDVFQLHLDRGSQSYRRKSSGKFPSLVMARKYLRQIQKYVSAIAKTKMVLFSGLLFLVAYGSAFVRHKMVAWWFTNHELGNRLAILG